MGIEKSFALPMFHVLTGCDTVSGFVGHGKKTAWTVWNSFPNLTTALLELALVYLLKFQNNVCISLRGLSSLSMTGQVPVLMLIKLRRNKLFAKTSCVKRIPPTHAAL